LVKQKQQNYDHQPTSRQQFQQKFGKPIEEYDSIKRAVESVREVTRLNYYRVLPGYFLFLNENPDQVIEQRRKDIGDKNYEQAENYERKTMAFANTLLSKGQSGRGVQGIIGRIQGFFANNSRRYSLDMRRLKLPKARKVQKYSPTNEELRHLYTIADSSRDRLIVALMYQNGLAPVDVSCLNVGDLPSEEWGYYEKSRSKTGEIFRSVVTPDIAYELRTYLKIRGNLSKGEPLFVGRQGPLDNQAISGILSDLIEKSGLDGNNGFKPTSLRDALEDALVEANVNHKIKEALMGHVSNIEHEYGGQNKLVINIVEAMKKTYPLLTLNGLTRVSTEHQVSKEEFASLEKRLTQLEEREEERRRDLERAIGIPATPWEDWPPEEKRLALQLLEAIRKPEKEKRG
jgi:site-specific recombinase XerD